MKILYAANRFRGAHTDVGGAESGHADVLDLMKGRGHHVEVLTPAVTTAEPRGDIQFHVLDEPSLHRDTFTGPLARLCRRQAVDPWTFLSTRRAILAFRPDVVHFGNLFGLDFGPLAAARHTGVPTVFSVYDYWPCCPRETLLDHRERTCSRSGHGPWCIACLAASRHVGPWERLELAGRRERHARWLARFDRIVTLSDHSRDVMNRAGVPEAKLEVIPLLAPEPVGNASRGPRKGDILFVGWIQQRKGLAVVIEALPAILRAVPDATLTVVGESTEPEYERAVHRRIAELGVGGSVRFLGRLTRAETLRRMSDAWVLALPEQWQNVSPVILAEAFALGLPVVASRVGGVEELLEDGVSGHAVPADDPAAFARALAAVLDSPGGRASMSRAARDAVAKRRSPQRLADAWETLYREVASCPN